LIAGHPAANVLIEQGRGALIVGQLQAVLVAYGLAAVLIPLVMMSTCKAQGIIMLL
jgi:hypothetical protein